jgi:sugar phosphate isomerase/epimerase
MATPELSVPEAMDLMGSLGLEGIEIIVGQDYRCSLPLEMPRQKLRNVKTHAQHAGLQIAQVVPYAWAVNHSDASHRQAAVDVLKRACDLASALGCRCVRLFAGAEVSETVWDESLERLVTSLSEVGDYALPLGLQLNIENHPGTMATSARNTVEIVEALGQPLFGILYDQGNLMELGAEGPAEAIALQQPYIRHVHVKDIKWEGGLRTATLLGQGHVPWKETLALLAATGYDGWLSLEYERRWHPEQLPDAAVGLVQARDFIRDRLKEGMEPDMR